MEQAALEGVVQALGTPVDRLFQVPSAAGPFRFLGPASGYSQQPSPLGDSSAAATSHTPHYPPHAGAHLLCHGVPRRAAVGGAHLSSRPQAVYRPAPPLYHMPAAAAPPDFAPPDFAPPDFPPPYPMAPGSRHCPGPGAGRRRLSPPGRGPIQRGLTFLAQPQPPQAC
ncbi:Hypothetical predicted protein [Marmota monax]|uniref:Uncharacterized protein n=1 Tax=Marmota monax TaxID=9995 RepID=A0A5E4DB75_MARMO|nr:Hypothetical predicted protein [Marmota monax]